ncbi:WD repeat-containing protein 74 [Temnothorax nylanderi]|uniref:WD repeat-containing protein 74 n=1 Tax=Temnothorax nylanderi TaxID=102681 RepID=UPI003A8C31ED
MSRKKFDIFVGATTGAVKGIKVGATKKETRVKNLLNLSLMTRDDRVTRIAWGDDDEGEILVACGKAERRVKIFDSDSGILTHTFSCNMGSGCINGISRYNGLVLTSVESGIVSLWSSATGKGQELVNAGKNLTSMCHSRVHKNLIATGGNENKVKLYNLEKQKLVFLEKDLPHDWLNLKRPVCTSDLSFLPGTQQIVSVSRHGHIHLFDPRAQRRPVVKMMAPEDAWTSLTTLPKEKHIIVGSTMGRMNLIDLRKAGTVLNTYKEFIGGITGISCSTTNPYVASTSLDRYLRMHNIDTKEVLKGIYLTSRLTCLIMRSDTTIEIGYEDGTEA